MHTILRTLTVLSIAFMLGGCPLIAGTIDSFGKIGIRDDDRQRILPETVKKFYEACYWGNSTAVMRYVVESERERLLPLLKVNPDKIRFVESRLEDVVFRDNAYTAVATSRIKYFEVPYYIVKERIDSQTWVFSISDGWKLQDIALKNPDL